MAAAAPDLLLTAMRILPGLIACLAGCAAADPGLRISAPPHAAPPTEPAGSADLDRADRTFASAGGLALYAQRWRPRSEPRGVVAIHHGLADHSDRYTGSTGVRVQIDRIDDLLDDLDAFIARVRAAERVS